MKYLGYSYKKCVVFFDNFILYKRYEQHSTKSPTLDSTNSLYQNGFPYKHSELSINFLLVVFTYNRSCCFDGDDSVL